MQDFLNIMLSEPFHPIKIAIFVACIVMSVIMFAQYKKDKDSRKLGYLGFFLTLAIGQLIGSLLYPNVISRKPMTVIQTAIPLIAIFFIFKFSIGKK